MSNLPELMLAIEASTRAMSVALFRAGALVEEDFRFEPGLQHSLQLLPALRDLLNRHDARIADLDAIAVSRGPGSFTSVRIGLATALGLGFADEIPVYGLSTLACMAPDDDDESSLLLPMLDARKGEVYGCLTAAGSPPGRFLIPACVRPVERLLEESLQQADAADRVICYGEGALAYQDRIESLDEARIRLDPRPGGLHPRAGRLGQRMLQYLENGIDPEPASPLYLRRPEAVINLEKKIE